MVENSSRGNFLFLDVRRVDMLMLMMLCFCCSSSQRAVKWESVQFLFQMSTLRFESKQCG